MVARFWPLLVIAFVVGSLFRLYTDTGIGFYRMFGTLGIAVLGAVASRIVVTAQLEEGERQVAEAVAQLPDELDVWRLGRRGIDRLIIGPAGAVVLLGSSVAHYARGRGLMRSLERLCARAERAAEVAREQLRQMRGEEADGTPIHRAVVFLRRQSGSEERSWLAERGIDLVEVHDLTSYVTGKVVPATPVWYTQGDRRESDA